MSGDEVLAIIPARCGSQSVPHKNVRLVGGKPLLAWSIEHALSARTVDRVIVSTDSSEYAELARQYGAETPFLRPPELAGDHSTDLEAFQHALHWLQANEGKIPGIVVHLRPTCPVRDPGMIDAIVTILREREDLDSVRTVTPVTHPPFKMWYRDDEGLLAPVADVPGLPDPWNQPRQVLPPTYVQTANIDVVRSDVILRGNSMSGKRIYGYVEDGFHDIDTEVELQEVAGVLSGSASAEEPEGGKKTYCFDIDGVIATLTPGNNYNLAGPRKGVIRVINRLHSKGNKIILHTARGSATGIDWRAVTERQLGEWGVQYDELYFGKPAADYYIDDKGVPLGVIEDLGE